MILVTGATAPVGRHLVEELLAAGHGVRALTRNPEEADMPEGAEVVAGDLSQPETLPAALEGVSAAFLQAYVPGFAPAFMGAAKDAGLNRVVFQSSEAVRDDLEEQPNPIAAFHHDIEREIEGSRLEWTFLRLEVLSSNAIQWAMEVPEQVRAGNDVVRGPYAEAEGSPIHVADIAAAGAVALTSDGHTGSKYLLTGPETLTHAEQVGIIGEAIGRPLRYEELAPEVAREEMIGHGQPPPVVDFLLGSWAGSVGNTAPITDAVERITGRPARTFARWASDYAEDFR
jgi:uncharacterized protein YbjT (DUF2867 family)